MSEQTMPTLDELREVIERRRQTYDSHLMDMPVNWENIAAMVSGIADAQNEYIAALEADRAAQQQRIEALKAALGSTESMLYQANQLLGSSWSFMLHNNLIKPDERAQKLIDAVERWNTLYAQRRSADLLHADAGEKDE